MPMEAILALADPDPGLAGDPLPGHAEVRQGADQHFLQLAQVAVQVAAAGGQIDDRVADQLPRAVPGHVPAAAAGGHLHPAPGQFGAGEEEVLGARPPAQGDHRRVFEEHQGVFATPAAPGDQLFLQRQRRAVGEASRAQAAKAPVGGGDSRGGWGHGNYCQWMQATGQASIASWICSSLAPAGS